MEASGVTTLYAHADRALPQKSSGASVQQTATRPTASKLQSAGLGVEPDVQAYFRPDQSPSIRKLSHSAVAGTVRSITNAAASTNIKHKAYCKLRQRNMDETPTVSLGLPCTTIICDITLLLILKMFIANSLLLEYTKHAGLNRGLCARRYAHFVYCIVDVEVNGAFGKLQKLGNLR
jgi:hypothetical protein